MLNWCLRNLSTAFTVGRNHSFIFQKGCGPSGEESSIPWAVKTANNIRIKEVASVRMGFTLYDLFILCSCRIIAGDFRNGKKLKVNAIAFAFQQPVVRVASRSLHPARIPDHQWQLKLPLQRYVQGSWTQVPSEWNHRQCVYWKHTLAQSGFCIHSFSGRLICMILDIISQI